MLGRTRRNRDDLALEWINWMRFQFLIKQKWTSGSAGLAGNRSELNPMQEALVLASNYGFQTARMTTTRRRWPLSLIYVCILLVHIHRRYNRSTGLLVFWASCHKQLRGPFTFCTHCSACSASCGFYYSPVSLSVQWQSQCLVLCKDDSLCPPPFELLHFKSN